jgi:hypothetical protein
MSATGEGTAGSPVAAQTLPGDAATQDCKAANKSIGTTSQTFREKKMMMTLV